MLLWFVVGLPLAWFQWILLNAMGHSFPCIFLDGFHRSLTSLETLWMWSFSFWFITAPFERNCLQYHFCRHWWMLNDFFAYICTYFQCTNKLITYLRKHTIITHDHNGKTKEMPQRAWCLIVTKCFHPQTLITTYHCNYSNNKYRDDCIVTHQVQVTHFGLRFVVIFFAHPFFQVSRAIYVAKSYAVIKHKGTTDGFLNDTVKDAVVIDDNGNFIKGVKSKLYFAKIHARDIVMICNQSYKLDDNNEPALENIP